MPLPEQKQVEASAKPRGAETIEQARERVMQELVGLAEASTNRSAAAMTASGFALAIAGLLIGTGRPVSPTAVAIIGAVALVAFYLALTGQGFHVGKPAARDINEDDLAEALFSCENKEFYALVAMTVAAVALGAEVIAFIVSAFH
ncbi:MAG TPA: hypothetical protein VII01_11510 [Solirubrobacteraceae bacterium]